MSCVKLFAVAGILLLALGTAESQYKNPRGFIEQEDKLDYKDMIIKKLLMKLNDVMRERRPVEVLQHAQPRPQLLPAKPIIQQAIPQHIPHLQQLQQIQIPAIHQPQHVRPALKHVQPYARVTEPQPQQQQQNFQGQYEYEEVQCPCGDCQCCQEVQYEEVPCPCCEQQQLPYAPGNRQQTGPIFTETFVSPPESNRTESPPPDTEKCANCCMSQGPITHLSSQRCSHCTQQPQMKSHQPPQPQPQQPQQTQQVIVVPSRTQVQTVLPHTLHPSFFTGFTSEDQHVEERIVQKTPFLHPKLNELLHASHSDTC